jgi:nucleoside-diphosphate-sugar epimerase
MRVFLAGASGVIGSRLVPLLVEAGHVVAGLTRTASKASLLEELGAEPVVGDVFDREWILAAVSAFQPDTVMHQLTDLPDDVTRVGEFAAANSRIRREGTPNLLRAARQSGVRRFLAQSVAWDLPGDGGRAVEEMEAAVLAAGGTVLRYGQFYGPGTFHPSTPPSPPRIHIDEAAQRTLDAFETGPGIVEIVER